MEIMVIDFVAPITTHNISCHLTFPKREQKKTLVVEDNTGFSNYLQILRVFSHEILSEHILELLCCSPEE